MSIKITGYKLFFNDIMLDDPIIHSDTLYGLICDTLFALNELNEDTIDLPFSMSSAFPFYDNYFFFPIPVDFNEKILVKLNVKNSNLFISKTLLQNYMNDDYNDLSIYQTGCFLAEESHPVHMIYPLYERISLYGAQKNNTLKFKDNSGLFFLAKPTKKASLNMLECALNFLEDEGIGAKRAVGRGSFRYEKFNFELPIENIKKHLLLSLYIPKKTDLLKPFFKNSSINWVKRTKNPFYGSVRESKSIYMAKEGAVFHNFDKNKPLGEIVKIFNANKKLGTQTPVYRFGKPFFMECP